MSIILHVFGLASLVASALSGGPPRPWQAQSLPECQKKDSRCEIKHTSNGQGMCFDTEQGRNQGGKLFCFQKYSPTSAPDARRIDDLAIYKAALKDCQSPSLLNAGVKAVGPAACDACCKQQLASSGTDSDFSKHTNGRVMVGDTDDKVEFETGKPSVNRNLACWCYVPDPNYDFGKFKSWNPKSRGTLDLSQLSQLE